MGAGGGLCHDGLTTQTESSTSGTSGFDARSDLSGERVKSDGGKAANAHLKMDSSSATAKNAMTWLLLVA